MQEKKQKPLLYQEKNECCGCSACYAICPTRAINMVADAEGYYYPSLDYSKCINCYLCITVCAFKTDFLLKQKEQQ